MTTEFIALEDAKVQEFAQAANEALSRGEHLDISVTWRMRGRGCIGPGHVVSSVGKVHGRDGETIVVKYAGLGRDDEVADFPHCQVEYSFVALAPPANFMPTRKRAQEQPVWHMEGTPTARGHRVETVGQAARQPLPNEAPPATEMQQMASQMVSLLTNTKHGSHIYTGQAQVPKTPEEILFMYPHVWLQRITSEHIIPSVAEAWKSSVDTFLATSSPGYISLASVHDLAAAAKAFEDWLRTAISWPAEALPDTIWRSGYRVCENVLRIAAVRRGGPNCVAEIVAQVAALWSKGTLLDYPAVIAAIAKLQRPSTPQSFRPQQATSDVFTKPFHKNRNGKN